jgi:hypothetical protein
MKRFSLFAVVAVLGAAALAGCGQNGLDCNPRNYPNGILPQQCYGPGAQPWNPGPGQPGFGPPGFFPPQQPPFGPPFGPPVFPPYGPNPYVYPCFGNPYCY